MSHVVRFDCFEADLASGELRRRGIRVRLPDQSFQVLASLLEHPGEVVTREDLRHRLWRDEVFVDFDNGLNIAIARLRTALGDSADHPRFIETLPKRGYRFIGSPTPSPGGEVVGTAPRARLVVLPFLNLNGNPAEEYFADAMTEEAITELASIAPEQIAVIARTTAMHYKGTRKDVARIGRELHADYLVEGGVRRDAGRVGITVQLIRVNDQTHVFAHRYEANLGDVFEMRTRIAEDLAAHLNEVGWSVKGTGRGAPRRKPTADVAAYNEYTRGRYLSQRATPESLARARPHFENAISRDPEFALAHVALADLYALTGYYGYMRPRDAFAIGMLHAARAVELDPALAEAHATLGEYHKQLDYDWPAARREMALALDLDPASPTVRARYAIDVLVPLGRIEDGIAEISRALDLDPLDLRSRTWLGTMWLLRGEPDLAIEEAERLLDLEPTSCWGHFVMGIAYQQKLQGRAAGSRPDPVFADRSVGGYARAVELSPGSNFFLGWLGLGLGKCGREAEARGVLQQLQESDRYNLPSAFAHVHYGLGDLDTALEWFDRAVEERDQMMMPILSFPEDIRRHPRYLALVRKMKLG